MPDTEHLRNLDKKRQEIAAELAGVGDFRPGFLSERFRRCGKPNCHCAREGDRGHGPSYSLTRVQDGKTVTKIIPALAVEETKKQMGEYKRFKKLVHDFTEINIRLCDARLAMGSSETEEAQKRGLKKRSKRKSERKSESS
jgi:hypothetical protein